jgi:hypothetical protein
MVSAPTAPDFAEKARARRGKRGSMMSLSASVNAAMKGGHGEEVGLTIRFALTGDV